MNTTIFIQNLKCNGCATTITNKLENLHDVSDIEVNVENNSVSFTYKDELAFENAKELLKVIGYPEVGEENKLSTKAKSYVSCAIGKMS
jgi:copper chaperone